MTIQPLSSASCSGSYQTIRWWSLAFPQVVLVILSHLHNSWNCQDVNACKLLPKKPVPSSFCQICQDTMKQEHTVHSVQKYKHSDKHLILELQATLQPYSLNRKQKSLVITQMCFRKIPEWLHQIWCCSTSIRCRIPCVKHWGMPAICMGQLPLDPLWHRSFFSCEQTHTKKVRRKLNEVAEGPSLQRP